MNPALRSPPVRHTMTLVSPAIMRLHCCAGGETLVIVAAQIRCRICGDRFDLLAPDNAARLGEELLRLECAPGPLLPGGEGEVTQIGGAS